MDSHTPTAEQPFVSGDYIAVCAAGVEFFRPHQDGKVHVFVGLTQYDDSPVAALMARQTALCGVRGAAAMQYGLHEFSDDDLCARCLHLTPAHERSRLFEHPVCGCTSHTPKEA